MTVNAALNNLDGRQRNRSYFAAMSGNTLEWFDWTLFAAFAPYIASNFFDRSDPASALLATLATFAVGFIARPIGGYVFGRYGDRLGRKTVLLITMGMMAVTSLGFALTPSFATIGVASSIILLVLRLLQGFAHGGESGVTYTYVAEVAPASRRAFWMSGVWMSGQAGALLATALGFTLTSILSTADMQSYGWRIAFGTGVLLGLGVIIVRRGASETIRQSSTRSDGVVAPRPVDRKAYLRRITVLILLVATCTMPFYIWGSFASTTAITTKGMNPQQAFLAASLAQIAIIGILPLAGLLCDKIGRKPTVMIYGATLAILAFPLSFLLGSAPVSLFFYMLIGLTVWALGAVALTTLLPENLPTGVRAVGVAFGLSLAVAIFGGTAPYLNAWLTSLNLSWVFTGYFALTGVAAVILVRFVPETRGIELDDVSLEAPKPFSGAAPVRSLQAG